MSTAHEEGWQWARERFVDEARILGGFCDPNIIAVHRLIQANGTVYLVMDHLEGESYEARLRRIGREPDESSLMAVISPLLDGLQEVHAASLLHRDIKPENILFDKRGNPVLIDFRAARATVGATMTMTSIVTHGYSPIEQYQTKGKMGPWTDIYAMAAVMCSAITGEKPPPAPDRLTEENPLRLQTERCSGFAPHFFEAVQRGLRVSGSERPQSIAEWQQCIQASKAPSEKPLSRTEHRNIPRATIKKPQILQKIPSTRGLQKTKKLIWAFTVVIAIILATLAIGIAFHRHRTPDSIFQAAVHQIKNGAGSNDCKTGLQTVKELAAKGYLPAIIHLGSVYQTKDPAEAVEWYRIAAEQGDTKSQSQLGRIYRDGVGVEKDLAESLRWWKSAVKKETPGHNARLAYFMYMVKASQRI